MLELGSPSSHQKLQHRRVRAWHYRKCARKRQRCQAFEIGHPQEARVSLERQPARTINEILRSTPIGRAVASASSEEKDCVSCLFEVAYMISREEMPFTKFPAILELDKRHGVCLGQTYHTEHKCQEFASIIGETMSDDLVEALGSCRDMSALMDGSTDSSVTEKEPFYVYVFFFFFFTQVQTPVTLFSGELSSILVVRLAHSADLRSRLRHVSSAPSVAYSTGCSWFTGVCKR